LRHILKSILILVNIIWNFERGSISKLEVLDISEQSGWPQGRIDWQVVGVTKATLHTLSDGNFY
jgi:hypothetical protein